MQYTRTIYVLTAAAAIGLLPLQSAAADDAEPGSLEACAAIVDDTQRLACFDALVQREVVVPVAPQASAPPAAAGPTPITDEIGRERVEGPDQGDSPVYTANVTRCEENRQSGQTYFYFENGQVWRQANYRALRLRDCRFEIELSEDRFGYTMHIPSEDRRVRVTRIR